MHWHIQGVVSATQPHDRLKEILRIILSDRGIENQEEFFSFLKPVDPRTWPFADLGISESALLKLKELVVDCKTAGKSVLVYGDYDADGVTATAILQRTLEHLGLTVVGYIPDRRSEGYGMKVSSLELLLEKHADIGLVITVDQGIVAHQAAAFLKQRQIPLVITDHHQKDKHVPEADAIIHTTATSGSGVAWIVSYYLLSDDALQTDLTAALMELATIGTVADLLPLRGFNRSLVTYGLACLRKTQHGGIQALFRQAKIPAESLDTYHIGYMLAPRINAMGRMSHAGEALQLLTESEDTSLLTTLAEKLEMTNRQRQDVTEELVKLAFTKISEPEKILIVDDELFDEGVVGLIAGKLTEKYHRPAVVISLQDGIAKASARSIKSIDIVKFLRQAEDLMEGVGGHAMAAGFSIQTQRVPELKKKLLKLADSLIDESGFEPTVEIDCEILLADISWKLWDYLESLSPYGVENQRPVFASLDLKVNEVRTFGMDNKHLRLWLEDNQGKRISGLGFNLGSVAEQLLSGKSRINIAYTISENTWKNKRSLELHIKDLQIIS